MRAIKGVVDPYFETGTEGVMWAVLEDGKEGYDALNIIDEGDHLKIYSPDSTVLFDGVIVKDTTTGLEPRPFNPDFRQQVALGFWVHWVQKGFAPDDWARLFFVEAAGAPPNRAELVRRKDEVQTNH